VRHLARDGTLPNVDAHLLERYGSTDGARAYRHKYEASLARRWSNRRELALVERALRRSGARGRLLDCPCGAGRLGPTILAHAEHLTGVDLSPTMVAEARDALSGFAAQGRVEFAVASADRLPFPDRAFDTVVCHRLIHHLGAGDRAAVLRELARVTQRRVILSFSDATSLKARLQALRGVRRRRSILTPAALADEAAQVGLTLEGKPERLASLFSTVAVAVLRVGSA
jgi:SAM-dependent methyltransferase